METLESVISEVLQKVEQSAISSAESARFPAQIMDEAGRILARAIGPDRAVTLDELTAMLSLSSRRQAEMLIESCLGSFPFLLVAGGPGYWRPTSAQQINAYLTSLHRRHRAMQMREKTVIRKSLLEAWPRENGWFVNPKDMQPMLIA